jgi:chromate transport protein ChrA
VSSRLVPAAALLLAVAWLLAQVASSPLLAAFVAVAGLVLSCLVAVTRRSPHRARALAAGLALLGAIVLASVVILLCWVKQGPIVLIILVLVVVIAGIIAPLLYARTFEKTT